MATVLEDADSGRSTADLLKRIGYFSDQELDKYLIGNPKRKVQVPLTLSTVREIHEKWLMSIPFENLSNHCDEAVILNVEKTFDKIVHRKRGGFCFEVNLLFHWLLQELGFSVIMLGGQVRAHGRFPGPHNEHLVVQLNMQGRKYICDVGLGKHSVISPLEMSLDVVMKIANGSYRFTQDKEHPQIWFLEKLLPLSSTRLNAEKQNSTDKAWNILYRFFLEPPALSDFVQPCQFHHQSSDSLFTCKSLTTLHIPGGVRIYRGFKFREALIDTDGNENTVEEKCLQNDDDVNGILKNKFSLVVDRSKFVPCDKPCPVFFE